MELHSLCSFCVLVGSAIHFLQDAKYISAVFLSLQWPAKIHVKSNLRKSSNT